MAIKLRRTKRGWVNSEWLDDLDTLLRMVDELTVQFNAERQAYNAIGRERDDLRAKLAEAARIHVESEAKHAYRVKELEAKLACAETTLNEYATALGATEAKLAEAEESIGRQDEESRALIQQWYDAAIANGKKANAAEARVRELESQLTRSSVKLESLRQDYVARMRRRIDHEEQYEAWLKEQVGNWEKQDAEDSGE